MLTEELVSLPTEPNWDTIKRIHGENPNVWKYIFTKSDAIAESVLYQYPTFETRTVICCSTQSGCPVGCRFCGAGDHFVRSLSAKEIISQPSFLLDDMGIDHRKVKNLQIMFMSMGEPLLNWEELRKALVVLNDIYKGAKLLISTIGPNISPKQWGDVVAVSRQISNIGLQFSIHESTDKKRDELIPLKGKWSLKTIGYYGRHWFDSTGRKPYVNYCAHENNTSVHDVDRLYRLFRPSVWDITVSVICERDETMKASHERQRKLALDFSEKLKDYGYKNIHIFDPAGQDDIAGGCGMLWQTQKWMKENPDKAKKSVGYELPVIHSPR